MVSSFRLSHEMEPILDLQVFAPWIQENSIDSALTFYVKRTRVKCLDSPSLHLPQFSSRSSLSNMVTLDASVLASEHGRCSSSRIRPLKPEELTAPSVPLKTSTVLFQCISRARFPSRLWFHTQHCFCRVNHPTCQDSVL